MSKNKVKAPTNFKKEFNKLAKSSKEAMKEAIKLMDKALLEKNNTDINTYKRMTQSRYKKLLKELKKYLEEQND